MIVKLLYTGRIIHLSVVASEKCLFLSDINFIVIRTLGERLCFASHQVGKGTEFDACRMS